MPTPNLAVVSDEAPAPAEAAPAQTPAAVEPSPDAKILTRIFEINREITRCEDDYLAKKESAANARKRLESAQEYLNSYIRKNEFPLLDQGAKGADDAPPAEPWRDTPVGALAEDHGLPPAVASRLADSGLGTIGALADWTNGGSALTDVKGVGEKAAGQIEDALASFWEANAVEEAGEAGPEGEGGPDEEES